MAVNQSRKRPHSHAPPAAFKKKKTITKNRRPRQNKDDEDEEEAAQVVVHNHAGKSHHNSTTRKRLDPQTKSYFLEIAALVNGGEGDAEERESICMRALEESSGQELQLACDSSCGRVLEDLLMACNVEQILEFVLRSTPVAVEMAVDPSGSHILETALKSLARSLQDQSVVSEAWFGSLESTLATVSEELGSKAVDVMFNRYGSHVLRCLFALLSGDSSEILPNTGQGAKPSRRLADKLGTFTTKPRYGQVVKSKGQAFPDILKSLVDRVFESTKGKMSEARMDLFAGPVLQALLKALKGKDEAVIQAIATILDGNSESNKKDGAVLENSSVEEVVAAMEDRSSSHMMEVVIQSAPNSLYLEIFQRFFRKRLLQLSLHPSANFTVQVLIACIRYGAQVNMIFEELEGNFTDLVFSKRSGVIAALFAACGRFQIRQKEACRALGVALNSAKPSPTLLVPRLLHLESASENGTFSEDLNTFSDSRMSVIGSVILQTIMKFPKECSQPFCASIAAMETTNLVQTVRDPSGSRALEAFLESPAAPTKHKHRIISKLQGHFAELALHPISCFMVEKSYAASDIKLKEKIVSELVSVEHDLTKSTSGARVSRRCDISGYTTKPEQWRMKENTKQNTHKAFTELFKPNVQQEAVKDEPEELSVTKKDEDSLREISGKEMSERSSIPPKKGKKKKSASGKQAVGGEKVREFEAMLRGL